jgi:hypothetical protein
MKRVKDTRKREGVREVRLDGKGKMDRRIGVGKEYRLKEERVEISEHRQNNKR